MAFDFSFLNPITDPIKKFTGSKGFQDVVNDPAFLQFAGNVGQGISEGKSMGEVLNPTSLIEAKVAANVGNEQSVRNARLEALLNKALGTETSELAKPGEEVLDPNIADPDKFETLVPTALTKAGINKRTSIFGKPDVLEVATPESIAEAQRNDTTGAFTSELPAEARPTGVGGMDSPFLRALQNLG